MRSPVRNSPRFSDVSFAPPSGLQSKEQTWPLEVKTERRIIGWSRTVYAVEAHSYTVVKVHPKTLRTEVDLRHALRDRHTSRSQRRFCGGDRWGVLSHAGSERARSMRRTCVQNCDPVFTRCTTSLSCTSNVHIVFSRRHTSLQAIFVAAICVRMLATAPSSCTERRKPKDPTKI